jgi:hypothetical protein
MYVWREAVTVPPVPKDHGPPPPPRNASLPRVATLYNKRTGGGQGAGEPPSKYPAHLAPALCMFYLLSVLSYISHRPPVNVSRTNSCGMQDLST